MKEFAQYVVTLKDIKAEGTPLFIDEFDKSISWDVYTNTGIGRFGRVLASDPDGGYSLLMTTRLTSPAKGDYVYIQRSIPIVSAKRYSVVAAVKAPSEYTQPVLWLEFGLGDVGQRRIYGIRINLRTVDIYYLDENGSWTLYTSPDWVFAYDVLRHITFTVDDNNAEYVKLCVDRNEYDLSGIKCFTESRDYSFEHFIRVGVIAGSVTTAGIELTEVGVYIT